MQTDKELMTVDQLVEDLAEFEEEYSDWSVVCWTPSGEPCYINDAEPDEEGDLCLSLDEDGDEVYDVASLIEVLGEYGDDTPVYVAARGLYLNIEAKADSTIFKEDHDEESDIEVVACRTSVIDKCDEEDTNDDLDEESASDDDESEKNSPLLKVALLVAIALSAYGAYYNVMKCVENISFEHVASALVCLILIIVSISSLLPSKHQKQSRK